MSKEVIQTPRFNARRDADAIIAKSQGFRLRHSAHLWRGAMASLILAGLCVGTGYYLWVKSPEHLSGVGVTILGSVAGIAALVGLTCMHKLFCAAKHAEFQSMILANGMNMHSQFSLIVNHDGAIVYSDHKSVAMFGNKAINRFDELIGYEGLSPNARYSLIQAVESKRNAQVAFQFCDEDNKIREMTVTLDPLSRPDGYFLVRGF